MDRQRCTAAVLLLVATFFEIGTAQNVQDEFNLNYIGAAQAQNVTMGLAMASLKGNSYRCADYGILTDGFSMGDGFSRIRSNATAAQQRILAAPTDSAIPMSFDDLDGVNVWVLRRLAELANFSVVFDVYKLPPRIQASPDKTLSILYLLNTKQYDCVLTATQLFAYRQPYMDATFRCANPETLPIGSQPLANRQRTNEGYIVTTLEGTPPVIPLLHRFWTWRTPFSDEVWGTLAASLIVIGWFMWFFERCDNEDDFGHHVHTPVYEQIWNGVYLAFAGFTSKTEEFSPKTLPGRFLGMIHAFAIFLTVSFYIANLATVFISAPAPDQPIKGIKSFSQLDLPACLGNKTAFTDFMTQAHPEIPLRIVSPSVTGVLDALIEDDPPCLGGVMTDVLFQYETGPIADPSGKYCNALMIGPQMGTNYYSIPFAKNTSYDEIVAINILVSNLILNGEYAGEAAQNFFVDRPQCQDTGDKSDAAPTLSIALEDFSGVFLVQAIGIVSALLLWVVTRVGGFALLKRQKDNGSKMKAGEDVGCVQYFFRAPPGEEESGEIPDGVKAIHEIRALLDSLEKRAREENGGGHHAGTRKEALAPHAGAQRIVVDLSSGTDVSQG